MGSDAFLASSSCVGPDKMTCNDLSLRDPGPLGAPLELLREELPKTMSPTPLGPQSLEESLLEGTDAQGLLHPLGLSSQSAIGRTKESISQASSAFGDRSADDAQLGAQPFLETPGSALDSAFEISTDQTLPASAEVLEIDPDEDPPERPPERFERTCNYESLSRLMVQDHPKRDKAVLTSGVRDVLAEMSNPPETFSNEQVAKDTGFLDNLQERILDSDRFVAGSFQNSFPAWEELLKDSKRQTSKKVLKWIREGVEPVFEGVKNTEPSKLNRVRGLLRHAVPKQQVEAYLKGDISHGITVQNHRSVYTHWPFTVDALEKLVTAGTAHLYGPKEGRPKVVNPLGVALNADKERLVLNMMYPNAFMKQMPFKYERLRDIPTFLKRGGFISSWDLKSGYFHVTIHPKYRTYFGFKMGDAVLHFNAVCFGWSQACSIFTVVMHKIFLEVRERSIPVSSYIDDGLTADKLYGRCLWSVVLIVKLLNYLGAYFGLPKCRLKPSQEGKWLGFEVISPEEIFQVSDKKMAKVRATLTQCLESESVTPRQLAAVAGKLISLSPAVLPASIYSRALFQAMQGKVSWDELFPKPEEVKATIED
jgi:hypothetical protein